MVTRFYKNKAFVRQFLCHNANISFEVGCITQILILRNFVKHYIKLSLEYAILSRECTDRID